MMQADTNTACCLCSSSPLGLTCSGRGGVTGEGRLRAGDWVARCGGERGWWPEVEEHVEPPGEGVEESRRPGDAMRCWLGAWPRTVW